MLPKGDELYLDLGFSEKQKRKIFKYTQRKGNAWEM